MSLSQTVHQRRTRLLRVRRSPRANRRQRDLRGRSARTAASRSTAASLTPLVALVLSVMTIVGVGRSAVVGAAAAGTGFASVPSQSAPVLNLAAIEGRDYSFLARVGGNPVRWACDASIYLVLQGPAPAGAGAAIERAATVLSSASGLDLRVGGPSARQSAITIRYGSIGTVDGDLHLDDDPELGVGGPTWSAHDGVIRSGAVLIRNDAQLSSPLTTTGKRVLLHEIGHALGLGHSAPDMPEVMGPTTGANDSDQLGSGDRVALERVGCRQR